MKISLINTMRAFATDRYLSALIVMGILFYTGLTVFIIYTNRPTDFYIYIIASKILSMHINIFEMGVMDYQILSQQIADGLGIQIKILPYYFYLYPSLTALLIIPLFLFPVTVSASIWIFLSGMASIFSGILLCTYTTDVIKQRVIIAFMICFLPIWTSMSLGQINVFVLFLTVCFLYWLRLSKNIAAGVILSFSIFMKPFALGILPLLFWRKKFAALFGFFIGTTLITLCSIVVFGLPTTISQFTNTVKSATPSGLSQFLTIQNLNALFGRLTSEASSVGLTLYILTGGIIGGLTLATILLRPDRDDFEREAALFIAATHLIAPLTWYHHLTMFSLVFACIVLSCHDSNWIMGFNKGSGKSQMGYIAAYLSAVTHHKHFKITALLLTGLLLTNLHALFWKQLSNMNLLLSSFPALTAIVIWGILLMQVRNNWNFHES
ncbi:MAG: glycosyltransferase family 87 protein [Desulfatirhabdiaceae bacterium]